LGARGCAALVAVPAASRHASPKPTVALALQLWQKDFVQTRFFHRFQIAWQLPARFRKREHLHDNGAGVGKRSDRRHRSSDAVEICLQFGVFAITHRVTAASRTV
jgi:hypothetical protein